MAAVSVNRGLPRPEAPAASLPKDQWDDLVIVRKLWAQSQLPFDCRMLKLVAADAPAMAAELGYGTEEAFLKEGLQLDPDLVNRVVSWLEQEQPTNAVPLSLADAASRARTAAAHRRPTAEEQGIKVVQDHFKPANKLSSRGWDRILPRLARDAPETLEKVKTGEIKSARAAAIEAGIITPFPSLQLKDPAPTAQKLLAKKGQAWCLQLLEELSELVL
ncbi:hypothetical protein UFOVP649_59 [uncultured Caudovirales phage]|uniref:Uncharacterized protein n=1 Tax=uncultured Caudovirales phage TaxID=2100421 RepID=A0A6J5N7I2_9CAUD|nr:hypothetical protein UFOVP649_59 [uncultured Caudovirales phage]